MSGLGESTRRLQSNWRDHYFIHIARRESKSMHQAALKNWKSYNPSARSSRFRMIGFSGGAE